MVEGPCCKLKGIKLKKRAKGQTVKSVSGNVIEKVPMSDEVSSTFKQLIGLVLTDVRTLGKELFAIFEKDVCLRVHFLMSGSVRYNNEPKELSDGNSEDPRLKLHMSDDEVSFFDCAVDIRSSTECLQKYELLIDRDICSPTFDAKQVTLTILEHPERLICDVILDQHILPGVGNIIKNEALFDAGINPNAKVKQLSQELVSHLVKMNRDFTNIFYKCRKESKDLRKSMRVYKKENCPECGSKITKCKVGEYERLTFFCRVCQTNTIRTTKKLAKRNSLLGWVEASKNQGPWNCSVCTLENKPANIKCVVCLTPKNTNSTQMVPDVTQPLQNQSTTFESGYSSSSVCLNMTTSSPAPFALKEKIYSGNKHSLESTPNESCRIGKYTFKRVSCNFNETASPSPTQQYTSGNSVSRLRTQDCSPRMTEQPKKIFGGHSRKKEEQLLCSGHKKAAKKTVVEKQNENRGRVFYVCNMPAFKQCKFFMWGDAHHPFCCHGKISVIRTVMKQNANNGREFYCCSLPKPKQCDFFEWADKKG